MADDSTTAATTYSLDAVQHAAQTSADDVLDAIGAGDTGVRDVVNLLVSTLLTRLDKPAATLDDVADTYGYGIDLATILDWCSEAVS